MARAIARLTPLLERVGFRFTRLEYDERAFGSAIAEYERHTHQLRLVWDGKEAALMADHRRAGSGRWIDVESAASGQPPRFDAAKDEARLERLAGAIEQVVAG
jgi:hypothetical protein